MDLNPKLTEAFNNPSVDRPSSVIGPTGEMLTLAMLPPPDVRWTPRRKAQVVSAVSGGLLTIKEALAMYNITIEEFDLWDRAIGRAGLHALRVTRIQTYRKILARD
jgi:Protein of unknown function (DUF1153)